MHSKTPLLTNKKMKSKSFAIAFMAAGLMMSACGNNQKNSDNSAESDSTKVATAAQATEDDEGVVRGIATIRKEWAGKTIKVNAGEKAPGIEQFALSFCKAYPQCETNKALGTYLESPNEYKGKDNFMVDDMSYSVYSNPGNGYVRSMMLVETNRYTYACFWKRKNAHLLFAAFMEECWETPDWDECLVVFYDYDPTTGVMTPEPNLTSMIEKRMKGYNSYSVILPEKGKEITVSGYTINEEEDSATSDDLNLVWNGMSFDWAK